MLSTAIIPAFCDWQQNRKYPQCTLHWRGTQDGFSGNMGVRLRDSLFHRRPGFCRVCYSPSILIFPEMPAHAVFAIGGVWRPYLPSSLLICGQCLFSEGPGRSVASVGPVSRQDPITTCHRAASVFIQSSGSEMQKTSRSTVSCTMSKHLTLPVLHMSY